MAVFLIFSYFKYPNSTDLHASCGAFNNCSESDMIATVISDSGGISIESFISWVEEGIKRVDLVLNNPVTKNNWSCEAWGVELENPIVRIYSLYDCDVVQNTNIITFRKALVAWQKFLEREPEQDYQEVLEL